MFKFNFFENQNETDSEPVNEKSWKEAKKMTCCYQTLSTEQSNLPVNINKYGDIDIKSFSESEAIEYLKEKGSNCVIQSEIQHSDLITAEYEGGFKVWECTIDLINFLKENDIDFKNKKVLDLGCGCGILGIYCLLKGAFVDFQDYNKEVIEDITISNVILNTVKETFDKCVHFYCGDWKSLQKLLKDNSYDYILTSETIYNQDNYQKLLNIFNEKIKSDGVTFLAAKTYYFGVGGGTREFEKSLNKITSLKSEVCWKCKEGVQREILKIVKQK